MPIQRICSQEVDLKLFLFRWHMDQMTDQVGMMANFVAKYISCFVNQLDEREHVLDEGHLCEAFDAC